jgi:EmrB/QacA subfamily drug resistance transporter
MASAVETPFQTSGLVRLTRPQLIGTMAGLLLSVLLASLDQTIVGTAEPRIIAQLSGFNRYPWVSTGYLLSSTIAVPIFAKLSDIYGRKWFFLTGAASFVLTSAFCGASGDLPLPFDGMNQLILFRSLQGLGGGMMMGLAFTIIGDVFSPVERGRYQGFFAATYGLSSIFGPTLGGWLTDSISWRAVFYVNLPVGLIAIAAIWRYFPYWRPSHDIQRRIDWAGVFSLIGCMVPLLLALTWVTEYGWGSARVESLLVFAAMMLAAFLYAETKAIEPMIPLSLFRDPVISLSSLAVFVLGMGMFAVIIYLPLFMQGVMGVSATKSGNLLTPLLMASVAGSITTGQLNLRMRKYKPQAVVGSILIAIGMILFARMDATAQYFEVVRNMVISGIGMGLLMPVYTVAVQNVAPHKYMGAATASTTFFRSIGSTLGVAIFGSVLLTNYHRDFAKGVPAGVPGPALDLFSNPLRLAQMRPQLESAFGKYPGGTELLRLLFADVRTALAHGLQLIFITSAVVMTAAIVLNVLLRDVPLKHHASDAAQPPAH